MTPFPLPSLRTSILIASHATVLCVGALGGWYLRDHDYQAHLKKDAQAQAAAQLEARVVEARNDIVVQEVREELAQAQTHTQTVYRTVTQEVPVYVTRTQFEEKVVAGGGLPAGLVWAYNQSAANSTAPLATGLSPDAPTGVDVSTLAGVTSGNFAMCHQWRAEVASWHDWYTRLAAAWPNTPTTDKE